MKKSWKKQNKKKKKHTHTANIAKTIGKSRKQNKTLKKHCKNYGKTLKNGENTVKTLCLLQTRRTKERKSENPQKKQDPKNEHFLITILLKKCDF